MLCHADGVHDFYCWAFAINISLLLLADAGIAAGALGFDDGEDVAIFAKETIVGETLKWSGIISREGNFNADLCAVAGIPSRFAQLRVDEIQTRLVFTNSIICHVLKPGRFCSQDEKNQDAIL